MFSREELYYEGQAVGDMYLDTPGILQLNRLLNQQPGIFLQNNAALTVMHKRIIVINNWGDDCEKEDSLHQYITLLLSEGFSIYQIVGHTLVRVTNLNPLNTMPSYVLNEKSVYKLLNDHNIEKKKVYLLDHEKIIKICGEFKQKSEFNDTVYPLINSSTSIEIDQYRTKYNNGNLILTNKVPDHIRFDERICRLSLKGFWDKSVLTVCNPDNLTALRLSQVPPEGLKALIDATPNVNTMYVRPDSQMVSLDELSHLQRLDRLILHESNKVGLNRVLPNLKHLTLVNLTMDAMELEALLQYMPNLETLKLLQVVIRGEFNKLQFMPLKSLSVTFCTMSDSTISCLVNQCQALVCLHIDLISTGYLEFEPKSFLRIFNLSNIKIKANALAALCSECLFYVGLWSIKLDGELTFSHALNHLAVLTMDRCIDESNSFWNHLSDRAPNLSKLVLGGDWHDFVVYKFPNLRSIHLKGNLIITKEQAIEILGNMYKGALAADIKMKVSDELIRYKQTYSQQVLVHELIVTNLPKDFTMPIIQACPWIKTVTVGTIDGYYLAPRQNPPNRQWVIATSININSSDYADWHSMEIDWRPPMQIKIDDFLCQYSVKPGFLPFMRVTGKGNAHDFSVFLQKFPKNQTYDLEFSNLDIIGELKTLPALNVGALTIVHTKLQAAKLARLLTNITHYTLRIFNCELLPPFDVKFGCKKVYTDLFSWNNGLFSLLHADHLVLPAHGSDTIKSNQSVTILEVPTVHTQFTLMACHHAFVNLKRMIIQYATSSDLERPSTNRFEVDHLSILRVDKISSMMGFIQQFPKIKNLFIGCFSKTALLDFKKYCPELECVTLVGDASLFKIKNLTYLVNALPIECKIVLSNFNFSHEVELLLTKYPQIEVKDCTVGLSEAHKTEKPLVADFKPYEPMHSSSLNPNWSQGMLINRLIAYLELVNPANRMYSSALKKGICSPVSKWFADTVQQKGLDAWNAQWQLIKSWDKQSLPLHDSKLGIALGELVTYVFNYRSLGSTGLGLTKPPIITNDLSQFLNSEPNKPLFVCNAWHRTCLIYQEKHWIYFDPNYKYGEPRRFTTKEEAVQEILRVLGRGLSIISNDESLQPCWNQDKGAINAFLECGGFDLIITNPDEMKKLKTRTLNKQALQGLFFLRMPHNEPFWYSGLTQGRIGNPIQCKTLILLAKYAKLTSDQDLVNALTKGMCYLPADKRVYLKSSLSKRKALQSCVNLIITCAENTPLPNVVENISWLQEKRELEPLIESDISKKSVQIKKPVNIKGLYEPTTLPLTHPFHITLAYADYQNNPTELLGNSPFKTWMMAKLEDFETLQAFDYFLSKHSSQNLLLHIHNNAQILNYLHHLQSSELMKARRLFVVNTFDDLHCAMSTITVDATGKGIIKPPNSGPLYDFLIENAAGSPVIAVNWSNFTAQQVIQANTLLDKHRHVDGVAVPKDSIIVGLQNPKSSKAYNGCDFSSRHAKLYEFPQHLNISAVDLPKLEENSSALHCEIELYDESNWEAYLYGHWKLTEKGFFFEKSALLQALEKKPQALHLVLKNAPFDKPDFTFAFNSLVSKGYCIVNGQRFELPKNTGISLETGYNFTELFAQTVISMERGYLSFDDDCVLNRDASTIFFENYQIIQDTKTLITLPGLLQNYANRSVSLCLTSSLPLGAYARLLESAKRYNTTLKLKVAPGVSIPKVIKPFMTENSPNIVSESMPTRLVVSNDLHYTEKMLQKEKAFDRIIDISEETKDKLLYALSGQLNGDKPVFNETISDFWYALMNNKRVLLKGHFSQALTDALANLLKPKGGIYHNGEWEIPSGELVLLADSEKYFTFVPHIEKVEVSFDNKMALLGSDKKARLLNKYSESQLKALSYSYLVELAQTSILPDKPDALITPFLQLPVMPYIDGDLRLEEAQASAFKEGRKANVLRYLNSRPTVFLSGETAVGKSSFMHELAQDPLISVTFNDIDIWLKATEIDTLNILFIDEANLVKTDFLNFEGLYSTPPSIFYKGRYYPLDDTFKVVFAGNPANYSNDRRLPKLFKNHPNCVVFSAMNNAYLHHEVLKPILGDNKDIARIFLKTFQVVKKMDREAISARELQMMAYIFQAQNKPEDATEKAKVIAFNMACQVLTPKDKPTFNDWFIKTFGELKPELEEMPKSIGRFSSKTEQMRKKKMRLTSSHYEVYQGLNAFMKVRHLKQQWKAKASFGGLSGFVLEGEPGVGKSYFVKEFLLDSGFYEKKIDETSFVAFDYETLAQSNPKPSSHFYYLQANLSPEVKIDLLNKAFHEGAVVIIDEINASPKIEELMNALLMGEDLKGRRALISGFSLIGTQNPSSMEGRERASIALARRVMHYHFPTYTIDEMVEVLIHKGLEVGRACAFIYEFLCHQYYARKVNLNPEPCFRDVLREAKNILKADNLHANPYLIQLPFAETVLINLLNVNNQKHKNLIIQMRHLGYERFFYVNEDNALCFLPHMQEDLKPILLDNEVTRLESHLEEIIKAQDYVGRKLVGNEALKHVLINAPLENLAIYLKTVRFEQIDFLQLSLDIMELDKPRFNIVGKLFKAFCKQVDDASSTNKDYKELIAKNHPESALYSKNRFFSESKAVEDEKSLISMFPKKT